MGEKSHPVKVPVVGVLAEEWGGRACRIQADEHRFGSKLVLLSESADGDGCCELVVGYTDRVVRAFRWEDLGEGTEHLTGQLVSLKKWMLEGQVRGWVSWSPGSREEGLLEGGSGRAVAGQGTG